MPQIKLPKPKLAFSLIELSVIILILSIISVGMLPLIKGNKIPDKFAITNQRINTIYQALGSFVAANKRLPCPALLNVAKGNSTYGNQTETPGTCTGSLTSTNATNLVYGMVPITALNLPIEMAEDGWGNKFEYVVDKRFTVKTRDENDNQGFEYQQTLPNSTGIAPDPIINILDVANTGNLVVTNYALFTIISHGANGFKAWSSDATTKNSNSGIADENNNSSDENAFNYDKNFVANSVNSGFDDILLYKTKQQLVRDAGMEFIRCSGLESVVSYPNADTQNWGNCDVASTMSFTNVVSGSTSSINCPVGCQGKVGRECGKYGEWASYSTRRCFLPLPCPSGSYCSNGNYSFTDVSVGNLNLVALKSDKKVVCIRSNSNDFGQCNVSNWSNIIKVASGNAHSLGLKADGSVVCAGSNASGQCNVSGWSNITKISAGVDISLGVKSDNTLVCAGSSTYCSSLNGMTNVVSAYAATEADMVVVVELDGNLLCTGARSNEGRCTGTNNWTNISPIAGTGNTTIAIMNDTAKTLRCSSTYPYCNGVDNLANSGIVDVQAARWHVLGLKNDGTIRTFYTYINNPSSWTNIVSFSSSDFTMTGIRTNGTLIALCTNDTIDICQRMQTEW